MNNWNLCHYTIDGKGSVVELNGQFGYAKTKGLQKEKIASELAQCVGAPVPRVEIGTVEGHGTYAISLIRNRESRPLAPKDIFAPRLNVLDHVIGSASGLLPFIGWIGESDHGDDTNFVLETNDGETRVVAIDFECAFEWGTSPGEIVLSVPPAFRQRIDAVVVEQMVRAVEGLSHEQIAECCASAPGASPSWEQNLAASLVQRQGLIRSAVQKMGWLA